MISSPGAELIIGNESGPNPQPARAGRGTEYNAALAGDVRRRNNRVNPKVDFAVTSPIGAWNDYLVRADRPLACAAC
jgi:hypothetical protein